MHIIKITVLSLFLHLFPGSCHSQILNSELIRQRSATTPLMSNNTDTIADFNSVDAQRNLFIYSSGITTLSISPTEMMKNNVYFRKDSSLFNGLLLNWDYSYRQDPNYPTVIALKFDNGQVIHIEKYGLAKATIDTIDRTIDRSFFPFYDYLPVEYRNARVLSHSNGFITEKFYPAEGIRCVEDLSTSTCLYYNGDTSNFRQTLYLDSVTISYSFTRNKPGETTHYSLEKRYKDRTSQWFRYELNENGDTLVYQRFINDLRDGAIIETQNYNRHLYTIRTTWRKGVLTDVLNDDVLYINDDYKLISEAEYISQFAKLSTNFEPLFTESTGKSGKTYALIAYSSNVSNIKLGTKIAKWEKKGFKDKF